MASLKFEQPTAKLLGNAIPQFTKRYRNRGDYKGQLRCNNCNKFFSVGKMVNFVQKNSKKLHKKHEGKIPASTGFCYHCEHPLWKYPEKNN